MCVPQMRSATLARKLRRISTLPGNAESLEVGEALHRLLHAFLVAEARILDAAEGRELEPVAGHLADVHRAHVQLAHEAGDVVEAVGADRGRKARDRAVRDRRRLVDPAK